MNQLFKNTYQTNSQRFKNYNYGWPGYYFITMNITHGKNLCGQIISKKIILNPLGKLINKVWQELPKHFNNIILDEFVIMPNHLHGIIIIKDDHGNILSRGEKKVFTPTINNLPRRDVANVDYKNDLIRRDVACNVSTTMSSISPKANSLSVIIRSFKSACSKQIHQLYPTFSFSWQSNYFDRIIRNQNELKKIRAYILNNPANWPRDRNNPKNFK